MQFHANFWKYPSVIYDMHFVQTYLVARNTPRLLWLCCKAHFIAVFRDGCLQIGSSWGLLACEAVQWYAWMPTFRTALLLPSSPSKSTWIAYLEALSEV
jgi:hypothetical protein